MSLVIKASVQVTRAQGGTALHGPSGPCGTSTASADHTVASQSPKCIVNHELEGGEKKWNNFSSTALAASSGSQSVKILTLLLKHRELPCECSGLEQHMDNQCPSLIAQPVDIIQPVINHTLWYLPCMHRPSTLGLIAVNQLLPVCFAQVNLIPSALIGGQMHFTSGCRLHRIWLPRIGV